MSTEEAIKKIYLALKPYADQEFNTEHDKIDQELEEACKQADKDHPKRKSNTKVEKAYRAAINKAEGAYYAQLYDALLEMKDRLKLGGGISHISKTLGGTINEL